VEKDVTQPKKSHITLCQTFMTLPATADTGLKGFEARQTKLIVLYLLEQAGLLLLQVLYIKLGQ